MIGFQLKVAGLAPLAARYAGFSERRLLWFALLFPARWRASPAASRRPDRSDN